MSAAAHLRPASTRPRPVERESGVWINRWLDRVAGPHPELFGTEASPYLVFGLSGVAVSFAAVAGLAMRLSFPISALAALSVLAVATFVAAGLVRKAIVKRDCHVLLEDVVCVLLATGAAAWTAGLPLATTLDLITVGLGVFLIFGRLGCLAGGCCHGRPCAFGIRYESGAVDDLLAGIRLFPVQLIEAAWLAVITAGAASFPFIHAPPGSAMWFWLIAYAVGRFVLELARGDRRPRLGALSEPQWLCVLILAARIVYEQITAASATPALRILPAAACALVIAAYATRHRWLSLPQAPIPLDAVPAWQRALAALEEQATASCGQKFECIVPSSGWQVRLLVDFASEGRQVHSYSLNGSKHGQDVQSILMVAGMIEQRLPAHWVLRASFCDAGVFHLWLLTDPSSSRGSTSEDPPLLVLERAHAFARMLREMPPVQPAVVPEVPEWKAEEAVAAWYFHSAAGGKQ